MSLLIKALATAEKDKQAELKKKQADIDASSQSLALAPFMALDLAVEQAIGQQSSLEEVTIPNTTLEQVDTKPLTLAVTPDSDLSLAQEVSSTTAKKSEHNPATSRAASNKVDAFNAAALASVAHVKTQAAAAQGSKQKTAANAFVANQTVKNSSSKSALILLGVAGALMIWLGLQGYQYIKDATAPEVVVLSPTPQVMDDNVASTDAPAQAPVGLQALTESQNDGVRTAEEVANIRVDDDSEHNEGAPKKLAQKNNALNAQANEINTSDNLQSAGGATKKSVDDLAAVKSAKNAVKNTNDAAGGYAVQAPANPQALTLISKTPVPGVDPTLLAAYQAFTRGEDASAQQQYRQVLQRDVRNIDALLGMAAIAQRQGRDADAMGWYQKVLGVEPRNTIAQSAMTSMQVQANFAGSNAAQGGVTNIDVVGTESRIKNMLAQQPEAANLHASLGNLFAAQNQWPSAQEAYFNASRFAPNNADYAFNLAISLEHLGKSGLALAQYQRALDLLNSSGASSPDRTQLLARIQALQASR